ncbi:sensor histidine kinase [Kaarinaea lacus]
MKYKHSLRFRITLTFFLFCTLLMISVALGVDYAMENIEQRVFKENLQKELQNFRQRYHENPDQPLPHSASMTAYLVGPGEDFRLPDYIRDLPPGTYEFSHDGRALQVVVDRVNGKKMVLELDVSLFERRETKIANAAIIVVILASVLALWLGYLVSKRAIAPVTNLAKTVAVLEPGKPTEKLSTQYVNDEVGGLARVFDQYLDRLQDFIAREQEFTSNASHELRTPLATIKGAVELLSIDTELPPRSRKVLQRIERAADTMSQMVDTLLVLAREGEITEDEIPKVSVVVQTVITDCHHLLNNKPIILDLQNKCDFGLRAPPSILAILLGNILRNAIAYTREGNITIAIESPFITVTDTGIGISSEDLPLVFERHFRASDGESVGSGLGLAIVKRICDRYNWQIDVNSSSDKGTVVSIDFTETL